MSSALSIAVHLRYCTSRHCRPAPCCRAARAPPNTTTFTGFLTRPTVTGYHSTHTAMESKSHAPLCPNDRISDWQKSCGFPTPPDNNLKRERSRSLPMDDQASDSRSGSPKRRRMEDSDDIQPGQSASQLATALTLNTKNTFSATASRTTSKRSGSPTRETKALLITACPPIITESIREAPPSHVNDLGDRLAKGIEFGFIPRGLMVHRIHSHDRIALTRL